MHAISNYLFSWENNAQYSSLTKNAACRGGHKIITKDQELPDSLGKHSKMLTVQEGRLTKPFKEFPVPLM